MDFIYTKTKMCRKYSYTFIDIMLHMGLNCLKADYVDEIF